MRGKKMPTLVKILLGGLLSALATWFLHGPMGLGAKCGVTAAAPEVEAAAPIAAAVPEAPATAEAVKDCQADVNAVVTGKTINFESSKAIIKADSMALIDAIAKASKDCAGTVIEVAGHTDQQGGDAPNLRLSEERANAVVAALTERGVARERLSPKGYGESKLLDAADTPAALAKNRRIEFTVAAAGASAPAAGAADGNAAAPAN
jgi:OmpA-OmpF porin, OOP family